MHFNIFMARVGVFIQSNEIHGHPIYSCIYNPDYACTTRRCRLGHQRRKTPTTQSVSGPVSYHFCLSGLCYRLRLLQTSFIQMQNEYWDFKSRWRRDFPRHFRPALQPTQTPVELTPGITAV
jgi:hypothetical protein